MTTKALIAAPDHMVEPTDAMDRVMEGPSHEEIAARAYERFMDRGAGDGADLNDWLEAERELLQERSIDTHYVRD